MMLSAVEVPGAPSPGGPYSPALAVGNLVFVSGQRPVSAATGLMPATFEEQATLVLENRFRVLSAAGSGPELVAKVSVHLADLGNFDDFNRIYGQFFAPPFPARTTVGSTLRGIKVEIDCIAVRRSEA
jgi:2-iminobutanoate/2-iminopropanoate deaminase